MAQARRYGAKAAAVVGSGQVFVAVVATTITLIAVFVPISFLPGDAGRLFTEFGFVLAVTVIISSFVALTVCQTLASIGDPLGKNNALFQWVGAGTSAVYAAMVGPMIRAPLIAIVMASLLADGAVLVYDDLGEELVPSVNRGMVSVWIKGHAVGAKLVLRARTSRVSIAESFSSARLIIRQLLLRRRK